MSSNQPMNDLENINNIRRSLISQVQRMLSEANHSSEVTWIIDEVGDPMLRVLYENTESRNRTPEMDLEDDDFIPFITETIRPFSLTEPETNCCICYEDKPSEQFCQLNCHHIFCHACIQHHKTRDDTCPLCRQTITHIYVQPSK